MACFFGPRTNEAIAANVPPASEHPESAKCACIPGLLSNQGKKYKFVFHNGSFYARKYQRMVLHSADTVTREDATVFDFLRSDCQERLGRGHNITDVAAVGSDDCDVQVIHRASVRIIDRVNLTPVVVESLGTSLLHGGGASRVLAIARKHICATADLENCSNPTCCKRRTAWPLLPGACHTHLWAQSLDGWKGKHPYPYLSSGSSALATTQLVVWQDFGILCF